MISSGPPPLQAFWRLDDSKMHFSRSKIPAFDGASLGILENLCDSTWHIFEARYPFRNFDQDDDLRHQLRLKLFILAESSGLEDLDGLQRRALAALSRALDY
jgi:hypothetical protein